MKERSTRCPPKLRILSAILAFSMLLTLLPVTAFAEDRTEIVNGVKYYQMNGIEVWWITGTYTGNATSLTLENRINGQDVNRIHGAVFKNNKNLTKVTLPTNVRFYEIGDEAFAGCTNLESPDFSKWLCRIGEKAFQNCISLKSIVWNGQSWVTAEASAFAGCTGLGSVTMSGTPVTLEDNAFEGCTSLKSVTLSGSSVKIRNNVFKGCTNLQEITLPKEIDSFGKNVFDGCTSLTKIIYNGKPTEWETCPAKDKIPANVQVECTEPLTTYGISVCGTTVNEANCSDVLKDGKVEFRPASNFLKLNSVNWSCNDANAVIDSTLESLTIAGNGDDTIINTSGPAIQTTGTLILDSSHIVLQGTPAAISAQTIRVDESDCWYRTSADEPYVEYTESVDIKNTPYLEIIHSQYNPNETGILLWINGERMPKIEGWESYDVFGNGTALLMEDDYDDVRGEKHWRCTLDLENANWESTDTAILTSVDQLMIIGNGTIKGGKNSIRTEYTGTEYGADVMISDANLTFTGGMDLNLGASITKSTVKINDWTDYGIKVESNSGIRIYESDVTIASETGKYALCPQVVEMHGNSTLRLQGAESIVNGGNQTCRIYADKYWYRTEPNGEYTEDTKNEFYLDPSYRYYELTTKDPYAVKTYDLWVAGKQVTETNQSNVLGNGSVSYDPNTHTLTLNNAHLTLDENADDDVYSCIDSDLTEALTITGKATLSNADGIMTDGSLTLNNADLTFTGDDEEGGEEAIRAGSSNEDITIQNSTVTVAGTNSEGNFFQYGIRCGNLTVANSTLDVKVYGSAIVADELDASGAGTVITAETDASEEQEYYALELGRLIMSHGLDLVEGEMNKSKKAKIARPEQAPTGFKVYWVVHPGDEPVNGGMQFPGAIFGSEEEARLFEGWFLEDGTRLEDSRYYMGPDAKYVGNLDRDVTFYGHWRTAESAEGSEDGDGFGTLLAGGAVIGAAGVVAYQVGTELILDQLLPAGVAVPHTRAELALLLWNTAGRPAPATLPAFADVADPELAQAAQWAIEQGILKARADGSFQPDKGVAKWRVIRGYRAVTEP